MDQYWPVRIDQVKYFHSWKLWISIEQVNCSRWNLVIPALTGSVLTRWTGPSKFLPISALTGSVLAWSFDPVNSFQFLKTMDQYWPVRIDPVKYFHFWKLWISIDLVNWTRWNLVIPAFTGSVLAWSFDPVNSFQFLHLLDLNWVVKIDLVSSFQFLKTMDQYWAGELDPVRYLYYWKLWISIDQVNCSRWNLVILALTGFELTSENWPGEILPFSENYGFELTRWTGPGEILPFLHLLDLNWVVKIDLVKYF